jgi:hypothetical protein
MQPLFLGSDFCKIWIFLGQQRHHVIKFIHFIFISHDALTLFIHWRVFVEKFWCLATTHWVWDLGDRIGVSVRVLLRRCLHAG